jgi:uncharacterized protein (DUF302 family)
LVGNAVVARDLFRYTAAAGLGAPVRVCVSQRHGEQTRIDLDQAAAFFSQISGNPVARDRRRRCAPVTKR